MRRHALSTRIWHWLNLLCVTILFMSGLTISNAHPWLYWGHWGFSPAQAWLAVPRFPNWATIPGYYSLSAARDWHLLMAWPFALGLLAMWLAMFVNGHFRHDIATRFADWRWRNVRRDIAAHLRLDFNHGGGKYNFLQRVSYGVVLGIILPGMILTGMGMAPGLESVMHPLIAVTGGRQTIRSLHFILAWSLFAFFVVHVAMLLLSGPLSQIRDMTTGGAHHAA